MRIYENYVAGIQTSSSDAKLVARSAEVPELSNKKTNLSSNTRMSSEQQVECGGGSMKLLSGFGKQKQFSVDTQCRFISFFLLVASFFLNID